MIGARITQALDNVWPLITLLIADNHNYFRQSLRQLCEVSGGFRVIAEAATSAEVVMLAQHHRPDAVLMDMHLPDRDGVETARLMLKEQPALVTVLLSFEWEADMVERARLSGAHAWLVKDCAESELFEAIKCGHASASSDFLS